MEQLKISKNEKTVLEKLSDNGFCAYIVGGGVRDRLMGKAPLDVDITTNATPQQVKQVFNEYKVIETGIKHGTVTVIVENQPFEITTFRKDGAYSDNRHPDSISYAERVEDDLARRDFTVNAIAYNQTDGIVDLYGGRQHIENRIIKCVGDPDRRFNEDALRIMRAVRFAATLDFEIEENTALAMRRWVKLLNNVSVERIFVELKKLLCGKAAGKVLRKYSFIIEQIIPELSASIGFNQKNPHHIYDVYEHTALVVDAAPQQEHLRLAALLHDVGKPLCFTVDSNNVGHFKGHANVSAKIARDVLTRLKSDKLTRERVALLIERHNDDIDNNVQQLSALLRLMGKDALFELFDLRDADNSAKSIKEKQCLEHTKVLRQTVNTLIEEQACIDIKQLDINGNDLLALGVPKSEQIGMILEKALQQVVRGNIANKKAELIEYVKGLLKGDK